MNNSKIESEVYNFLTLFLYKYSALCSYILKSKVAKLMLHNFYISYAHDSVKGTIIITLLQRTYKSNVSSNTGFSEFLIIFVCCIV